MHEDHSTLRERVARNPLWYHTMELAPGVVTPGRFDLRPVVDRMPWPEVRGRRCLDIGTYDGFLAFELERRGASEVVATDVSDHNGWDWSAPLRALGPERLAAMAGAEKGAGFELARDALSSRVERVEASIYELGPERLGTFDVVVCGSLLLHLKDPVRALEAVAGVCRGRFVSAEQIDLQLSILRPRTAVARFEEGRRLQWWISNAAAHAALLRSAGWELLAVARPYSIPLGPTHPATRRGVRPSIRRALQRLATGGVGVPHSALLARPATSAPVTRTTS